MHAHAPLRRAALFAATLLFVPGSRGQPAVSEWELKAALVFNFARYTEWPERAFASRESPLLLCVVGRDRSGGLFSALESRKLQGRPVKVRLNVSAEEARSCHLAFISEPLERQLVPLLHSLAGAPVLTVSDSEGFIDSGGAIGIVPGEQRLQFEVNRGALEQAQLKASSQLLRLARAVLGQGS